MHLKSIFIVDHRVEVRPEYRFGVFIRLDLLLDIDKRSDRLFTAEV